MPDMSQLAALLAVGGAVALVVALPFLRPSDGSHDAAAANDVEDTVLRREIALDALRDLESDRAAGSLDDAQYAALREEAEGRAASVLAALDAERAESADSPQVANASAPSQRGAGTGARAAAILGAGLGVLLLAGFVMPGAPLANPTVVDEELAAAIAAEEARAAEIDRLLDQLTEDPRDVTAFSALADAYLAGSTQEDLSRGASALLAVIELDPRNADAYTRLITAYIRAGDYENAAAATEAFSRLAPGSADLAFFQGVIALRGAEDAPAAIAAFDRFLELAPDDPRAGMVATLRAEAAGELPGGSGD